jgi:tripartite ATP-independent transporter DctM subunit
MNMRASLSRFTLLPITMFVLLGQVMFRSGMGMNMLDALGKWLGRLPGRLALIAVGFSTLFATMSGSSVASTSLMGTVLRPEMEKRGYKKPISIGSIMGAGGLASLIPPSGLAIIIAVIGEISIGRLLIAGIIPGLMIATLYTSYIILRCNFQPSVAPPYEVTVPPLREKVRDTAKYVLPLGLIIFLVLGLIFLGVATPTEAAAMGAVGSLILATIYKKLTRDMFRQSVTGTLRTVVMVYMIIAMAVTFGQIMAFSGVTIGLIEFALGLTVPPVVVIVFIMLTVLVMGTFMDVTAIIFISMPIFMPVIKALGFDPVWFGLIMLVNIEMALTTPPFGMLLFVMKGTTSSDTTMGDIYRAALPFLGCDAIAMGLVIVFPALALWLPSNML